ncbi:hypothetical protein [Rhodococcus sp. X156]|uniref:hypothetical protein n=1 Tax=Rhodococcus sp. X156 TaxID=2499145 RepID=UPI000FD6BE4E|nr:hypothetical protein [Rhodococcus sp. X156]
MENDFAPAGALTPAQARQALDGLDVDGARLAEQMVTPWWYHPSLGLVVALIVGAQALPGSAAVVLVALGVIAIPVLTTTYRRRYGISTTQPAGPRSRRLLFLTAGIFLLAMVASTFGKLAGLASGWALLPAVLALVTTVVLGRRYDDVLRSELARTTAERA